METVRFKKLPEDIKVELPGLGVVILIDGGVLMAIARRAHANRSNAAQMGPARATVNGPIPTEFQNRYSVHYEDTRGEHRYTHGTAVSGVFRAKAEEVFEEYVATGQWTYVELRGPSEPSRKGGVVALKAHGKKREGA